MRGILNAIPGSVLAIKLSQSGNYAGPVLIEKKTSEFPISYVARRNHDQDDAEHAYH